MELYCVNCGEVYQDSIKCGHMLCEECSQKYLCCRWCGVVVALDSLSDKEEYEGICNDCYESSDWDDDFENWEDDE